METCTLGESNEETSHEDIETPCRALHGNICGVCSRLTSLDSEVRRARAYLESVLQERDSFKARANCVHASIIDRLPAELASLVFKFYVSGEGSPLTLGAACQNWRRRAWSTPNLWTTVEIIIKGAEVSALYIQLVKEWLNRSGGLPLSFKIDMKLLSNHDLILDGFDALIDLVNERSNQWHSLDLLLPHRVLARLDDSSRSSNPMQFFRLRSTFLDPDRRNVLDNLTQISPHTVNISEHRILPESFNWSCIVDLTISNLSAAQIIEVLRQGSQLRNCCFSLEEIRDSPSGPSAHPRVIHPRIISLALSSYRKNPMEWLLNSIDLPGLQDFAMRPKLPMRLDLQPLQSFIGRSGMDLQSLSLTSTSMIGEDLIELATLTPALHHLSVSLPVTRRDSLGEFYTSLSGHLDASAAPRNPQAPTIPAATPLLPRLRTFEWYGGPCGFLWEGIAHFFAPLNQAQDSEEYRPLESMQIMCNRNSCSSPIPYIPEDILSKIDAYKADIQIGVQLVKPGATYGEEGWGDLREMSLEKLQEEPFKPYLKIHNVMRVCTRCGYEGQASEATQTPCQASQTECYEACRRFIYLEEEARRTRLNLETIMKELDSLKSRINRAHPSRIDRLPAELASLVFQFCASGKDSPLTLGAVCQNWRRIAWSTPSLWATMAIVRRAENFSETHVQLVKEHLSRSGQLPLSISVEAGGDCDPDTVPEALHALINVVNDYCNRWDTLSLYLPSFVIAHLNDARRVSKCPMTSLALRISVDQEDSFTPNLTRVTARQITVDRPQLIPAHWGWDKTSELKASGMPIPEILRVLGLGLSLEQCTFDIRVQLICTTGLVFNPVSHSRLSRLEVESLQSVQASQLLSALNLPALKDLTIRTYDSGISVESLISFITRSNMDLISLCLDDCNFTSDEMISISKLTPSLRYLDLIVNTGEEDELIDFYHALAGHLFPQESSRALSEPILPLMQKFRWFGDRGFPWATLPSFFATLIPGQDDHAHRPIDMFEIHYDNDRVLSHLPYIPGEIIKQMDRLTDVKFSVDIRVEDGTCRDLRALSLERLRDEHGWGILPM